MRIHNNKLGNQILSLLMALVMVLGMMPMTSFTAFAADTTACAHSFGDSGVCTLCGITGGYCGASTNTGGETSVTWTLADDGTLTISGTGAMADYEYGSNPAPWHSYRDSIQTVIIGYGISTIGNFAIELCRNLSSITIPDSVTSIGICAFADCYSLISINIPNSVEYIGDQAFYNCFALESITIPDSVTSIGNHAFRYCSSLTSITIPDSVTSIGTNAFDSCSSLTSITIPDSVTSIGEKTFRGCVGLTSITIPDSVTSIGTDAFYLCTALTTVTASCKWKTYFPNYENIGTFTHTKVDGYTAKGNKIYYNCENGCIYDSLAAARLEFASDDAIYYTGSAITPEVKVTYVNGASAETLPLTVSKCEYSNNTEPGTATCTVTYQEGYVLTLDFTINKIKPTVSVLPTVEDRVYDPSVALQDSDLTGGTVYDEKNSILSGTWSWQEAKIPEVNNSGYVAVFTPTDTTYYDTVTATITVNVAKATPTVTAPTANTLTYNGEAKALVTAGNTTGGTLQYKVGDGEWSTNLPEATNAGTYTVSYKVDGGNNYNDVAEQSFTVTVAKATPTVTANTLTYNGQAQALITAGSTGRTLLYKVGDGEWSADLPEATNAGTYTVSYKGVGNDNYNAVAEQSITVTIAKATPEVTAPTAVSGLIYSGGAQTLITAGNTTAGTMQYKVDDGVWSTDLPKATNAGTYTVYYKVVVNNNYNDVAETSFTVTIACDHTHNTNTEYKAVPDTNTHSMICSVCGEAITGEHSGGTATCSSGKICETCGSEYGEVDTTNHDSSVAFNEKGFCPNCDEYQPCEGSGTEADPYKIGNAGQLMWFANLVNGGTSNANAVLTKNITVNQNLLTSMTYDAAGAVTNGDSFRVWTPIGNYSNNYTGTFDGNNKTVSGLYFNDSDIGDVGLFGYVGSGGKVQNIGVIDSYLRGGDDVGGVVGGNYGMVQNCYNSGTVTGGTSVGGVVGRNNSTVENCYNTGAVSGRSSVGGVVGDNEGTVESCYNAGSVSGRSYGGVVGWNYIGTVTNCYFNTDTYSGNAIGTNNGTVDTLTGGKTAAQFASGEVTWLLNGGVTDGTQVWYQTCEQGLPAFSGQTVYQVSVTYCDNTSTTAYSNVNENVTGTHKYAAPTFGWTSDYAECRAVFTCSICGASENVNCTVTADTTDPTKTVYTASAILNGVTYTDTKEVEHIISVDISWGAMEFTYTDGEWNPETHTYGEGKWTPDAENGNVITVTNNGNVAVNVAFAYTKTVTEVEGSFTDESGSAITSPFALATEEEKKIKLMLNGKPSSTFEDTQLGSVTITITLPEEDES